MKSCFKCGKSLPLSEFYRHPQMKDGTLNKCKECTKADVRNNYMANHEKYAVYEQKRNKTEHRKERIVGYQRDKRARNPHKASAYRRVHSAVKSGRLNKKPCVFCGNVKVQAHHHDYSKPLDVVWVCFKCHREKFHNQIVV